MGVLLAVGVFLAWPGSVGRLWLADLTKYRACFLFPGDAAAANSTVGFGDSITAGRHHDVLHAGAKNSYFDVLACERNSPITYLANTGVWGSSTAQMLTRLDRDVISHHPRQVLIVAGTNDVREGHPELVVPNLTTMVDRLRKAGIRPVFGTLPPSDDYPGQTKAMNDQLHTWATDTKVPLIDFWTPLAGPGGRYAPGMSDDGEHPNFNGSAKLAAAASAFLRQKVSG